MLFANKKRRIEYVHQANLLQIIREGYANQVIFLDAVEYVVARKDQDERGHPGYPYLYVEHFSRLVHTHTYTFFGYLNGLASIACPQRWVPMFPIL